MSGPDPRVQKRRPEGKAVDDLEEEGPVLGNTSTALGNQALLFASRTGQPLIPGGDRTALMGNQALAQAALASPTPTRPPDAESVEEGGTTVDVLEVLRQIAVGDFEEDPEAAAIVIRMLLTLIPGVDQVADVEDVAAALEALIWDERTDDAGVWFSLVVTAVGFIPELRSAFKGIVKLVRKVAGDVDLQEVKKIVEQLGFSAHIVDMFRHVDELLPRLPELSATVQTHVLRLFSRIEEQLRRLRSVSFLVGSRMARRLEQLEAALATVRRQAGEQVPKAMDDLGRQIAELSAKWRGHRVDAPGGLEIPNAYTKADVPTQHAADPRFDDLAKDPANGGRTGPNSLREASTALEAEGRGLIPGPVRRGPPIADFYDGDGIPWDVKKPISPPPGQSNFEDSAPWASIIKKLETQAPHGVTGQPTPVRILLDSSFLNTEDHARLWSVLRESLSPEKLSRIIERKPRLIPAAHQGSTGE